MKRKRKKRPNKETKAYQNWEVRNLKRKCLRLWSSKVRELADKKCAICGSGESLHSHHLEDNRLCSALRYDIRNGVCLCARHHKYCIDAAHKSFSVMFKFMTENRLDDIQYLMSHRNNGVVWSKELLLQRIEELNGQIA